MSHSLEGKFVPMSSTGQVDEGGGMGELVGGQRDPRVATSHGDMPLLERVLLGCHYALCPKELGSYYLLIYLYLCIYVCICVSIYFCGNRELNKVLVYVRQGLYHWATFITSKLFILKK